MKNFLKRTVAVLMIVLSISLIAPFGSIVKAAGSGPSTKGLITNTGDKITRAEWLHNLAVVFEMTVEDEIYPDNYFSDLEDTHEYYYDLLLNVNFGVIDVEAGGEVNPDGAVTRSFASHTLNYCLGYQLDSETYTFTDSALCEYPADDQIAINRGWFVLIEGKFCPNMAVTDKEVKAMLDDTEDVIDDSEIDVDYDSKFTFSSEVIEVKDGTELEFNGDAITIKDSSIKIANGDIFAVYQSGIPLIYKANTVSKDGKNVIVKATYIEEDVDKYILEADAQGEADFEDVIITPAEGVEVDLNYEEPPVRLFAFGKDEGKKKIANISAKGTINLSDFGYSISYSVEMKNPTIQYAYNLSKRTAQVSFECEIEDKATFKADLLKAGFIEKEVMIYTLSVPGVGGLDVCLKFDLSGSVSVVSKSNFKVGASYSPKDNFRTIKNFSGGSFSLEAKISGSAGVIVKLGVTQFKLVSAYVYAEAGGKASVDLKMYSSGTPKNCVEFAAYVYANYGATFEIDAGIWKYEAKAEEKIWDSKTSPARIVKHYEEEKPVAKCTRGGTGSSGPSGSGGGGSRGNYYTKYDSAYSGGWSDGDNSYGFDKTGKPVQLFEYKLDKEGNATITAYKGNATVVNIPETIDGHKVIAIGKSAFEDKNIYSVDISDSVKEIEAFAFKNCYNLRMVELSNSLTFLGEEAYANCTSLTSIEIPASMDKVGTWIDKAPFYNCSSLKNVTFGEGITKIPNRLFEDCTGLESIVIPNTVTEINAFAFNRCVNLAYVKLSNSLTYLGEEAFANCTSLTSIEIPASMDKVGTWIDKAPFYNCSSLKNVTFGEGITKISNRLFEDCTGLENVTIPDTVVSIEENAFNGCINLKNIKLSDSLKKIYKRAFANCSSLHTIIIPESLEFLPEELFLNSGLEFIEIPKNIVSLGYDIFKGCKFLKEIKLPTSIEEIPTSAFEGCILLESIILPESIKKISASAFFGAGLEIITLPSTVQTLCDAVFQDCISLKKITLNEGLTTVGEFVFKNCTLLKEIIFNDDLTTISKGAFQNCDALTSITIPNSVKSIGYGAFYDCDILEKVTLGNSLEAIPNNAFEHCDVLSEIVLPYRVASIGSNAFKDCVKFTSITIPRATTKIADNAFSYFDRLTIYGVSGTYAETYAKEKGIKFVNKSVPATKVELSKTELELAKGATANLVLNITPADFTDAVTWKSSDESIVTIDETGKVTAKGLGTATIKVDVGSVSATCKVTVVQPVTGVNIDKSSLELEALETYQLKVTVNPNNAANKAVKWSTSDETIATVDQNGLVTTLKKGSTTIKCEALDGSGKYDTCTVNVKNNGVIAVTVSELESTHDYSVDCTDFWQYTIKGATKLDVTFDSRTNIEDGFDYLYIYDAAGKEVGKYTGAALAGKTITVNGDTVRLQLASDKSGTAWGFKVTDVKPASGAHTHSYTETITKAATCTATGIKTLICGCGDSRTEVIPATGHKNVTSDSGKAPTTTEVGYTAGKYCNDCKTWIEGHNEIPKVDDTHTHKYSSKVTKEATCTENGVRTYTCSCGDSYTESIDKIEHEYVTETWKATLTTNGGYKKLCKYCGKITGEGIYYSPEVIKLSTEKYTYDGKTKKPSVFVEDKMGVDFKVGTDYTVKYESGRKAPGKYTVTITFIGKYEGKKVLEFKILPGKTSNITATQSASAIKLTWKKVTGATGYRIYQYNSKTKKYEKLKTTTETSYTIKKLKAGTEYKFAVKAYTKDSSETLWASSSKTIRTATEPAVPTVKITAGSKKATLKWNKVTGATGYVVYMKNSDGSYKKLGSTKSTSYTKNSLKSGKKYYFRVRAYKTVDGKNIYGGYKTYSVKVK